MHVGPRGLRSLSIFVACLASATGLIGTGLVWGVELGCTRKPGGVTCVCLLSTVPKHVVGLVHHPAASTSTTPTISTHIPTHSRPRPSFSSPPTPTGPPPPTEQPASSRSSPVMLILDGLGLTPFILALLYLVSAVWIGSKLRYLQRQSQEMTTMKMFTIRSVHHPSIQPPPHQPHTHPLPPPPPTHAQRPPLLQHALPELRGAGRLLRAVHRGGQPARGGHGRAGPRHPILREGTCVIDVCVCVYGKE